MLDSGCAERATEPVPSAGPQTAPGLPQAGGPGAATHLGGLSSSSGRQSASGRSGRRAGRWAVGRRTALAGSSNVYNGPLPGRAGPRQRGASLRACGPLGTSPGKEDSAESRVETVGLGARRRGVGAGPGLANARGLAAPGGVRREGRLGAAGGGRGRGAAGSGRSAGSGGVDDGVSGLLPRSAPSLRITHAGGGGRRERGGQGAERTGPRARGRSGPRAPCGPREPPGARPGRRGPPVGGSVRRRCNAEGCHAGREGEGWGAESWRAGLGGALGPHRRLEGARGRAAARRVFTFPLVERQCRHLSASARHFRRRGSWSGCGSGVGAGLSHARGAPQSGGPRCGPRGGTGAAWRRGCSPGPRRLPPRRRRRGWERWAVLFPSRRSLFVCTSGGLEPLRCAHPRHVEG